MAYSCSKCGSKFGFFSSSVKIRGKEYCTSCARTFPNCKECRYFSRYAEPPYVGGCTYNEYLLHDYDVYDVCSHFSKG